MLAYYNLNEYSLFEDTFIELVAARLVIGRSPAICSRFNELSDPSNRFPPAAASSFCQTREIQVPRLHQQVIDPRAPLFWKKRVPSPCPAASNRYRTLGPS